MASYLVVAEDMVSRTEETAMARHEEITIRRKGNEQHATPVDS